MRVDESAWESDTVWSQTLMRSLITAWSRLKAPAKRGHNVAVALFPAMLPVRGQTRQHCCASREHKTCFWRFSKTVFCVQDTIFVHHKCCARGRTSEHLRKQCCRQNVSSFCRAQVSESKIISYFLHCHYDDRSTHYYRWWKHRWLNTEDC